MGSFIHSFIYLLYKDYDVAVMTLNTPVTTITPIRLPPAGSNDLYLGEPATLAGWGITNVTST